MNPSIRIDSVKVEGLPKGFEALWAGKLKKVGRFFVIAAPYESISYPDREGAILWIIDPKQTLVAFGDGPLPCECCRFDVDTGRGEVRAGDISLELPQAGEENEEVEMFRLSRR